MPRIELAYPTPYDVGAPKINAPSIYGASPGRPFLYKIPVVGARPLRFSIEGPLVEGLILDEARGILSGMARQSGRYPIRIHVSNSLGEDSENICLDIATDNALRTPLLGWTSWNAFAWNVSQENVRRTAELMVSLGLSSYGYQYVNIDSSWQGQYGGSYDAIMPNAKFPDMAGLFETLHRLGLKGGIYSTPMRKAWGLPGNVDGLPGCTLGEADPRFPLANYPIGLERREENNVRQWCEWGIDYLKYDWKPSDRENAELMKQHLRTADRDIPFCVTVRADPAEVEYWKRNCCSYRHNNDSGDNWETVKELCFGADQWARHSVQGHFFDLDMLEIGHVIDFNTGEYHDSLLTEDEQLVAFSARALFPSPIQLSCDLERFTAFETAMCCNDEILAVNQDALGIGAVCVAESITHNDTYGIEEHTKIYRRILEDGSHAVGFFNIGETVAEMRLPLRNDLSVRDLWAKKTLGVFENELSLVVEPHTVRMLRLSKPIE